MESRMTMNTTCCLQVRGRVAINLLAAILMLLCCGAGTADGAALGRFKKLFVFGDSYVDTGNRDPNNSTYTAIGPVNQAWRPPYGRTQHGGPDGRFSDGIVLSDFLGNYMGLHPATYRKYKSNRWTRIGNGMNFAVGGAGVFDNLGFTKTRDQIAQFKALVDAFVYTSPSVFSESAVLFAISGNDYGAYTRNFPGSDVTDIIIIEVVNQMVKDIKSLYDMGFRSFIISQMEPLDCLPSATVVTNYTTCVAPPLIVSRNHNLYLTTAIAATFPPSTGADVIFLNNEYAFYDVLYNPLTSGSLFPLRPCCVAETGALCGDRDGNGNPRYTLCSSSSPSPFFWDENHPTEAGWGQVFSLYVNTVRYTQGRSLPDFLGVQ